MDPFILRSQEAQGDDGKKCADIGFEQVGTHTCYVTDIVADVVSDNGRVSRVVFRNACFDFTDQVGTDVCSFGVDTAADTGEESDRRCP